MPSKHPSFSQPTEALSFTVESARALSGLSRTTLYKLASRGDLRMIKVYGRTVVDGASLRALLAQGTTSPNATRRHHPTA